MNLRYALCGAIVAGALTVGMATNARAQQDSNVGLTGQAGTVCSVTANAGNALNFGIYTYTNGDYLHEGDRLSSVGITIVITTNARPADCSVTVAGTNLLNVTGSTGQIPVSRVSLGQGSGGGPTVNPIAALSTSSQTLISNVAGSPLGNGIANATATLTLTDADDNNPPGTYQGSITFTGVEIAP